MQENFPNSILPREKKRQQQAYSIREQAALSEIQRPVIYHPTNGDEEAYPNKVGSFSKCLPHNALGEVDINAYALLTKALKSCEFEDFKAIPTSGILRIASPLGGSSFSISVPDSQSIEVSLPHSFCSINLAAEMTELYWMALLRDVHFSDYETSPLVAEAIEELSAFPSGLFPRDPSSGIITPSSLFLVEYPGVLAGPRVSQFLLQDYVFDGVLVKQKLSTPLSVMDADGIDFLTDYDEWLVVQKGFPSGTNPGEPRMDPQPRSIRNMRDMGWNAYQSSVISTYLKAALLLLNLGREVLDDANPYKSTRSIGGFGTFDFAHLMTLLGQITTAGHFNFQKWHHRTLRPEAFGGRIHNHLRGLAHYPIHESILQSVAIDKIFEYNTTSNKRRGIGNEKGSYLLPCLFGEGSPTHPSFPAGHGVAAGIAASLLKAWFQEDYVLPDSLTVKPNRDGTSLEPYIAGRDGPALTIGGELNKLAHNMTLGRSMSGIHYRMDGVAGNRLGEELAVRILAEVQMTCLEPFDGFTLTKFDGEKITIK
jgi:hypothetical protein